MPEDNKPVYQVRMAPSRPDLDGAWDSGPWRDAETLEVAHFRPEGSDHRPVTQAKVLYDNEGLYVFFRVEDRYVLCTHTEYHGDVFKDACVEFFVQPKPDKSYLNFEINCGGTLLLNYNEGAYRRPDGSMASTHVPWDIASRVDIHPSMPKVVSPERTDPVVWTLAYFVPYSVLEEYVGPIGSPAGQEWRGNFYKCAEDNSHPHAGSWSRVEGKLDFHQPEFFAPVRFEA